VRSRPIYINTLVLHVPWQRNRPSHQRLPYLHRHQAQDEPRHNPTFTTTTIQGGQPYHTIGSAQLATFLILPFALSSTSIPKFLDPISANYQSYHYATTNHPQAPPATQITYHPAPPQLTYPMPNNTNANQLKAEPNPPPPHLRSKLRNLCNKPRIFPPMAPYSQSSEVQTQTLKPKDSIGTTIAKLTMSLLKHPVTQTKWLTY
jgi:hypothetical protein